MQIIHLLQTFLAGRQPNYAIKSLCYLNTCFALLSDSDKMYSLLGQAWMTFMDAFQFKSSSQALFQTTHCLSVTYYFLRWLPLQTLAEAFATTMYTLSNTADKNTDIQNIQSVFKVLDSGALFVCSWHDHKELCYL